MSGFATRPPVAAILAMQGHSDATLKPLSRPGAWLLDYCYTLISVLERRARDTAHYVAVANSTHKLVLQTCFPELAQDQTNSSPNNRGNQMETLAWLMLEADRPDLLLALAYRLFHTAHQEEGNDASDSEPPDMGRLQQFLSDMMAKSDASGGTQARASGPSSLPRAPPPAKAMPTRGPP